MPNEHQMRPQRRYVDELPRVDIGHPSDWPRSFIPPPIAHRPAGVLIGERPRTRASWICPGCGRGARSLWFGVVPKPQGSPLQAPPNASHPQNDPTHRPLPAGCAAGALGRPTSELESCPHWLCRRCLGLTHRCKYRCPASCAADRARRIRRKLGAPETLYTGDPPIPPGMALSTDPAVGLLDYDELVNDLTRAEFESLNFPGRELRAKRGY